jgi:hypothetical protein
MVAAAGTAIAAPAMSTATVSATANMRWTHGSNRGMAHSAATMAETGCMHRPHCLRSRRIAEIGVYVMPRAAVHMREVPEAVRVRELLNGGRILHIAVALHIAVIDMARAVLRPAHRKRRDTIVSRGVMPAPNVLMMSDAFVAEFAPVPEVVYPRVERAVPIMAAPIRPDVESDNRKSDFRPFIDDDDALAAI